MKYALTIICAGMMMSVFSRADTLVSDVITYRGDDGNTVVDVFIKVSTDSLIAVEAEGETFIEVSFSVSVLDSLSSSRISDKWDRHLGSPPQATMGSDVYFLDSATFDLPPGTYDFIIELTDRNSYSSYSLRKSETIPSYSAPGLQLSDPILASAIQRAEVPGQFVRNGYAISPNPDHRFGARSRIMYVYHELYGGTTGAAVEDSFEVTYRILDEFGRQVRAFAPEIKRRSGPNTAHVGGLSIAGLSKGRYTLSIRVEDRTSGLHTTARTPFEIVPYRFSPGSPELTDEEISKSIDIISYLGSSREKALLEGLDETGRANFVRRFWSDRDPNGSEPGNTYFYEMLKRYDYANERFSGHIPGWLTDRGRIYISYGQPRDVERHVNNPDTKDYEIWTYAIEGETMFIFVDERGFGQYRLVHSNARDEVQNADWESFVRPIEGDFP